jgi:hypothetical protein
MMPDVLVDAQAGDTVELGRILSQLRQQRLDAAPPCPPRRPELPSQPVDRGMLGPPLSDRTTSTLGSSPSPAAGRSARLAR